VIVSPAQGQAAHQKPNRRRRKTSSTISLAISSSASAQLSYPCQLNRVRARRALQQAQQQRKQRRPRFRSCHLFVRSRSLLALIKPANITSL
jgi:hypothetical protein